MLRSVRGFIPWIAFGLLDWRYGALLGLAIAVVLIATDRRSGRRWDELVIELSAVAFLTVLAVVAFADPTSPVKTYAPALSAGWLAVTAWGSLALRKPFTLGIARNLAPPEVWGTPAFYQVNAVITAVWSTAFTLSAVALTLLYRQTPHSTLATTAVTVAGFVLPALFSVRYPALVRARAQTQTRARTSVG